LTARISEVKKSVVQVEEECGMKMSKRTAQGLRDALFAELEGLQRGDVDPPRALAVANVARQIMNSVRIELDYARELSRLRESGSDVAIGTLQLGSENLVVSGAGKGATARS
jgi:hypothetical protein